jgi:hypothetical protein
MSRRPGFYGTVDYQNAQGIARALREEIGAYWRLMHRERRRAADENIPDPYQFSETSAAYFERQLRFLLEIRRTGIRENQGNPPQAPLQS